MNFLVATAVTMSAYWLPPLLIGLLIHLYFYYIRARFIHQHPFVLLELKLPKEITKTPRSMEIALTALYQTWDNDNFLIGNLIIGQVRTWFSLELVSLEGKIHFYIWTQRFFQRIVESQLYAQYPEVEIVEVEDYTKQIPYGQSGSDWKMWGVDFKLSKEDAYPIKTYVHYGLDEETKEEFKADPLTAMLEFLGSAGPGEQIWVQILVMGAKDRFHKPGTWFGKQSWKDEGKALVEKLMKRDKAKAVIEEGGGLGALLLSPGERRVVDEVERSTGKLGFDCGLRAGYFARGDHFNRFHIPGLLSSIKQYNSQDLNGFKVRSRTTIMYPWQDPTGRRLAKKKMQFFDAYRRRSYFYPPYKRKPFVLNTEELATIFHLPGRVAATPSLAKIESKRSEPPVNLPV